MSLTSFLKMSAIVVIGALTTAYQAQAQATDGAPTSNTSAVFMAVLDVDGINTKSKAMKNIHEQFAKYQTDMQASVDQEKQALQKDDEALNRKRTLLSPEQFAEERKKFQGRIVGLQRKVQESSLRLNQVRAKATAKVGEVLRAVVSDIVKANEIKLVFHKSQIVFMVPGLDITDLVLAELDKRLPSVQVDNPNTK